jgi:hypothetical protein
MFLGMIASVIMLLVIVAYMATSSIVVDSNEVKTTFEKIKYVYPTEKMLVDGIENLCQKDPATCKAKETAGVISLSINDLLGYIPASFVNDNMNGGSFTGFEIRDNYTTIRVLQNLPSDTGRKIYLNHYKGREYAIPPKCVVGAETSSPPCSTADVFHDYPTTLETRAALGI